MYNQEEDFIAYGMFTTLVVYVLFGLLPSLLWAIEAPLKAVLLSALFFPSIVLVFMIGTLLFAGLWKLIFWMGGRDED